MYVFRYILMTLGGITFFILGLKFMSGNMEKLTGKNMQKVLGTFTKNKYAGVLTGAISTALIQSSIATNVILVGFVSSGILSFYSASAVIMGANIGTTITAQLVSLSGSSAFDITALGSLIAFIGLILSFFKNEKLNLTGGVFAGFGMLFFGLNVISDSVAYFKNFEAFRSFFLVKNHFILLINGIVVTAIIQSSSAVTSVMIILASNGLLSFESSMFLILGSNIGTCVCVLFAASGKSIEARRSAFFNIFFNIVGAVILFFPLSIFSSQVSSAFATFSGGIERQIANFHTLFNVVVTIILLPALKPVTNLCSLIINDKKPSKRVGYRLKVSKT
ncbi:MAG: Na/Pi cotransporter family protein [Clostridiales bacterium]|nr:Na/Pi cotransporter family protein [Clostridiales bacterium]